MAYSDEDVVELCGNEEDAHIPDSQQDIKPRHHKGKKNPQGNFEPQANTNRKTIEDDSDFDDDDDDEINQWNVRKCAASTIDVLATVYGDDLLDNLLPLINEQLFHPDWKRKESGILALGAIAEG